MPSPLLEMPPTIAANETALSPIENALLQSQENFSQDAKDARRLSSISSTIGQLGVVSTGIVSATWAISPLSASIGLPGLIATTAISFIAFKAAARFKQAAQYVEQKQQQLSKPIAQIEQGAPIDDVIAALKESVNPKKTGVSSDALPGVVGTAAFTHQSSSALSIAHNHSTAKSSIDGHTLSPSGLQSRLHEQRLHKEAITSNPHELADLVSKATTLPASSSRFKAPSH